MSVNAQHITMTRKQYQVVKLMARGLTQAQAARELGVDSGTVSWHLKRLREAMHRKSNEHLFYGLGLACGRDLPVSLVDEEAAP